MEQKEIAPRKPRTVLSVLFGLVGAFYLLNPSAGIFELIPDNLPVVGNLDEAAATILVINAVRALRRRRDQKP